jgi:hypothetical protein
MRPPLFSGAIIPVDYGAIEPENDRGVIGAEYAIKAIVLNCNRGVAVAGKESQHAPIIGD